MKLISKLAMCVFLTFKTFALEPVIINFDSWADLDNRGSERLIELTNKACKNLKQNEGIRRIGVESVSSDSGRLNREIGIRTKSEIGIKAIVNIPGVEPIVHDFVICYVEKTSAVFNSLTNELNIKLDPTKRFLYVNDLAAKDYKLGWEELYSANEKFLETNSTYFDLINLPLYTRIKISTNDSSSLTSEQFVVYEYEVKPMRYLPVPPVKSARAIYTVTDDVTQIFVDGVNREIH
jgi:hypothetical protein